MKTKFPDKLFVTICNRGSEDAYFFATNTLEMTYDGGDEEPVEVGEYRLVSKPVKVTRKLELS